VLGGKLWEENAQISLIDTNWHKVELKFSDFERGGNETPQNDILDVDKINIIQIGANRLGNAAEQYGVFYIDQIQVEPHVKIQINQRNKVQGGVMNTGNNAYDKKDFSAFNCFGF